MRTSLRYATPYMDSSWGVAAMTASSTDSLSKVHVTPQRYFPLRVLTLPLPSAVPGGLTGMAQCQVHTAQASSGGDAQHSALAALNSDRGVPGLHAD